MISIKNEYNTFGITHVDDKREVRVDWYFIDLNTPIKKNTAFNIFSE